MSGPGETPVELGGNAAVPVATEIRQPGGALVEAPVKIVFLRQPVAKLRMAYEGTPTALRAKTAAERGSLAQRLQYVKGWRTPQNVTEEERIQMLEQNLSQNIQTYGTEAAAGASVEPTDKGVLDFARRHATARRAITVNTSLQAGKTARTEQQRIEAELHAQWEAQKASLPPGLRQVAEDAEARGAANVISPEARRENLTMEAVTKDGTPIIFKGVGKFTGRDVPIFFNTDDVKASSVVAIGTGPNGADNMKVYEATTVSMRDANDKKAKWDGQVILRPVIDPKEEGQLYQSRTVFSTEPSAGTLDVPLPTDVRERLGIPLETKQTIERRLQPTSIVGRLTRK
ncbi:MAG: hypothetical protein ACD_57C00129G0002 [uncultured bacterium]|uniref:Uncharacterized protein n=1 Tax=Candidatus Woesebacteria bacterium RIFCSPHIGHO2_12_FULL_41_24 TaxID=1802510 RepID=A0A1F8ASX7_9BACT|nr:MAG: hypothetical protein ACD_57C00129G0002 [uncultured bacterium]OGM35127.1 MAG: hypothetical protein A3D84_02160 [Candidatus Woesebacteria bacterium RIFCSPHIGHO2_02_FULL_42_20]OGM54863.1 MAG: hypothetical protein A3E44_01760 [Candidatus Woesebacteria bacterium RIFCSPHIGHO2_12_FULL_41_24]OGM69378.1 MAG: hypothetical protein A3I55_01180 [Candidatus Woesebacteria bacterium RIFCSPLOWO2_02_FULL_42_10]OGM72984.1 MAG: hypothetical protein A3H21_03590 [Candidatus Woesebacteria bacterium RIFCSPLOWO